MPNKSTKCAIHLSRILSLKTHDSGAVKNQESSPYLDLKRQAWAEGCRGPYSRVGGSGHDGGGAQPGLSVSRNEFVPSDSSCARFISAEPRGGARGSLPAGRRWRRRGQRAAGPGRAGGAAAIGGTRLPPGGNKRLATARPHRHTFTALLLSSQGDQGMRECGFLRFIPNPVCVHPVTGLLQTTDQTSE